MIESLHSVGGAITFIALFQQIYTNVIESILSRSYTKSVNVYLSKNTQPRNNKQGVGFFLYIIHIKALDAMFYLQWNFFENYDVTKRKPYVCDIYSSVQKWAKKMKTT